MQTFMKYFNKSVRCFAVEYAFFNVTTISCTVKSYFYVANNFIVRNGIY